MHQTRWLYFPFLVPLSVFWSFFSFSASSFLGTQHQLTTPPVKSTTLPLRKMLILQGVAHRQTNFTLSCVIPLWDSGTAHSSSDKKLNPSSQGRCPSLRTLRLGMQISLYPASSLFGTQQQLTHPPVKNSSFPIWKNDGSQGLLFCNVLTLSCLDPLWFGTHPYYSLNPYARLYYLSSISIAKYRRYPKYFNLCVVYFYSEKPPLYRGKYPKNLVESAK